KGCAAIPQEVGDLPEMVVIARHRRANSVPVPPGSGIRSNGVTRGGLPLRWWGHLPIQPLPAKEGLFCLQGAKSLVGVLCPLAQGGGPHLECSAFGRAANMSKLIMTNKES